MTTYSRDDPAVNNSEIYDDLFQKRGVKNITQYPTKIFSRTFKDKEISYYVHYWSQGDRYHKLASKFYGDYRLWWVIAMFNEQPSEGNINYGDKIMIPANANDVAGEI